VGVRGKVLVAEDEDLVRPERFAQVFGGDVVPVGGRSTPTISTPTISAPSTAPSTALAGWTSNGAVRGAG